MTSYPEKITFGEMRYSGVRARCWVYRSLWQARQR